MKKTYLSDDYILRQIITAGTAMARIIALRGAGLYQDALQEINQTIEQLFGLDADLVKRMDDRYLLDVLTTQDKLDIGRLLVAAELFKHEGDALVAQKEVKASSWSYMRSLNFYLEVFFARSKEEDISKLRNNIESLTQTLENFPLPEETRYALFSYYERIGKYRQAENVLKVLSAEPALQGGILVEQIEFYQRLLEKNSGDLQDDSLTHDQIKNKLAELQKEA